MMNNALDVVAEVPSFGQFESLLHLAFGFLSIFHLHRECSLTFQECDTIILWIFGMKLKESHSIFDCDVESNIKWGGVVHAKFNIHRSQSYKACSISFASTYVLEASFKV